MQEIRQTEIDGQRGVFVPIYETADVSGWKRIVQMRDDQILELQNTIRQQRHAMGQFAREGYACPSGAAPAIKEAEDKIAQEYTASRLSRLEAEVKELRELWGKTEDARASMQGEAHTAAHDIKILQKRVAELTFPAGSKASDLSFNRTNEQYPGFYREDANFAQIRVCEEHIYQLEKQIIELKGMCGNLAMACGHYDLGKDLGAKLVPMRIAEAYEENLRRQELEIKDLKGMLEKNSQDLEAKNGQIKKLDSALKERDKLVGVFHGPGGGYPPKDGFAAGTFLSEAVARLRHALASDADLFQGYEANIAAAIQETVRPYAHEIDTSYLSGLAHAAAGRYLDNFIHPLKRADAAKV